MRTYIIRSEASRNFVLAALSAMPLEKPLRVRVDQAYAKRSAAQNDRYWMLLRCISEQVPDEHGQFYEPEVWHEYLVGKLLPKEVMIVDGEVVFVRRQTRRMNTVQFADYMTQVEQWGAEHGVRFEPEEWYECEEMAKGPDW